MKIGLVGYYGFNEYCDDLIALGIKNTFDEEYNVLRSTDKIDWKTLPLGEGNYSDLDLVILGGGSLLGLDLIPLCDGLKKYPNLKFCIMGAGTRSFLNMNSLKYLYNRTPYVAVRGSVTAENLDLTGCDTEKISIFGDSIFLHHDEVMQREQYIGIVYRSHELPIHKDMVDGINYLVERFNMPYKMIKFCARQGDLGEDVSLERAYESVCKSSFWFGNRLHTSAIALINQVPTIPIEIEFRKVEDLCSSIGYNYYIKANEMNKLNRTCNELMSKWDVTRRLVTDNINHIHNKYHDFINEILVWSMN